MDLYEEFMRPEGRCAKSRNKARANRLGGALRERQFGDFECRHCHQPVSAEPNLSGVNHRNHCPYCLWSKHVDLRVPGDRLGACKGAMQPVGLTFKHRHKKYACAQPGELMVVHQCATCGALSINRIAADDSPAALWDVFEASLRLDSALHAIAQPARIDVLGVEAREVVQTRLFERDGL